MGKYEVLLFIISSIILGFIFYIILKILNRDRRD